MIVFYQCTITQAIQFLLAIKLDEKFQVKKKINITILYIFFALLSTGVNLITQWFIFILFSNTFTIYIALFIGTFTGLVTKYFFDKKWIFYYTPKNRYDNFYKFILYSFMGAFTTIIFWGTEISFYYFFDFRGSQYVGGGLGLIIGYFLKYILDKRYVFKVSS